MLRLWLEWQLYSLVFVIVFYITGYANAKLSAKEIIMTFLPITYGANTGYIGSMLCLCLLIPFLNLLIGAMNQKCYLRLLAILLFINTVISTFSLWNDTFGFIEWLCCTYLIGAYLRLYGEKFLRKRAMLFWGTSLSMGLMWLSIIIVDTFGRQYGFTNFYYMSVDANKLLSLTAAIFLFLLFKSIPLGKHTIINRLGATCYGVLCIHANSDTMRHFLWGDLLHNADFYDSPYLIVHAILSVLGVFAVCAGIEMIQKRFVFNPLMAKVESAFSYIRSNRKGNIR